MRLPAAPAGVALLLTLLAAAAAEAQTPRLAAFLHHDSLAVMVDCAPLLTPARRQRLNDGYPLSFVLDLSLRRYHPVWLDTQVMARRASFRLTRETWGTAYRCALGDFRGRTAEIESTRLEDLLLQIEDRLSTSLTAASGLDGQARYYCAVSVEYRNLTVADVKSAEEWLRGAAAIDTAVAQGGRPLGGAVMGVLWDLAGLRGERQETATPKFRLSQLRRLG